MTAFKRFDATAFFLNPKYSPAATAAPAARSPDVRGLSKFAADAASAAGGDQGKCLFKTNDTERFEERAAIIEFDAGVPREWAEGFARLCLMPRHPDFMEERWQRLIDDAGMFLDRWAVQVAAMGWTTREVFGVDDRKPYARLDQMGLVPLIGGDKVMAVSADSATIQTPTGARQRIFRRADKQSPGRVSVWELNNSTQRG